MTSDKVEVWAFWAVTKSLQPWKRQESYAAVKFSVELFMDFRINIMVCMCMIFAHIMQGWGGMVFDVSSVPRLRDLDFNLLSNQHLFISPSKKGLRSPLL